MKIVPAILSETLFGIEEKFELVKDLVEWVQIDVVDGKFATPETWPYTSIDIDQEIPKLANLSGKAKIELHLMVDQPENKLDEWLDNPVDRILIHYEASQNIEDAITILDMSQCESGLVLNLDTPIEVIEPFADRLDMVQLMSIGEIGSYGAGFEEEVLDKVDTLREMFPEVKISLDGGINQENIEAVRSASVDSAVVGSAIFGSDNPEDAISKLNG